MSIMHLEELSVDHGEGDHVWSDEGSFTFVKDKPFAPTLRAGYSFTQGMLYLCPAKISEER